MFNNIISKWRNFISEAKVEEQPPEEKPARVPRPSAGVLLYKKDGDNVLVYLVHEGGPHNENNRYAWGIPKGRIIEIYGPESSGKTTLIHILYGILYI